MANLPPSTLSPAWSVVAELNPTPCSLAWHLSPAVDPRAGSESRYDGPFPLSSSPKGIGTWPELSGCQAAAISLFCGRVLTEGSWLSSLLPKAAGPSLSGTLESSFRGCCLGVRLQPAPPRRSQWSTAASFAAGLLCAPLRVAQRTNEPLNTRSAGADHLPSQSAQACAATAPLR
jgi:hypothetical protein